MTSYRDDMQQLAPSASPPHADQNRPYHLIAVVLLVGLSAFAYGFASTIGLLPIGWGIHGVFQFLMLLVGSLVVSLLTLITIQFRRQDQPQRLTGKQAVQLGLIASAVAFVVIITPWSIRVGYFMIPQFPEWILLGLLVLSLQFALGTVTPKRMRRLLLLTELGVVFVAIFGFLAVDRGEINVASYVVASGGATVLLLLFGGPLYLLGNRLHKSK